MEDNKMDVDKGDFNRFLRLSCIPRGEFARMMWNRLVIGALRYGSRPRRTWSDGKKPDYVETVRRRMTWASHEKFVDIANLAFVAFIKYRKFYEEHDNTVDTLAAFAGKNAFDLTVVARSQYAQFDRRQHTSIEEHDARVEWK